MSGNAISVLSCLCGVHWLCVAYSPGSLYITIVVANSYAEQHYWNSYILCADSMEVAPNHMVAVLYKYSAPLCKVVRELPDTRGQTTAGGHDCRELAGLCCRLVVATDNDDLVPSRGVAILRNARPTKVSLVAIIIPFSFCNKYCWFSYWYCYVGGYPGNYPLIDNSCIGQLVCVLSMVTPDEGYCCGDWW